MKVKALFPLFSFVGAGAITACATDSPSTRVGVNHQADTTGLGCFADSSNRDLPYLAYDNGNNTTENCTSACLDAGYQYAGTQYSTQCFCGNSYGGQGTSANCNMPCSGNGSETCGGGWANDVHATGFLGCYADSSNRDLPVELYDNGNNSTENCISACANAGYAYAGTQYSTQCFCGNSYGGQGSSSNCNMTCSGNGSETCGGSWANDVYATGSGGGAAVVQTLTDHGVSSSHANGTQKCVWQFSRPIGAGDTVVGYVHSANNNDNTEMYPQSVYDDVGNSYDLSPGVHWSPYPEDIGIWYLANIQGNPSAFTFDYTQYPASGNTVLDFCDLGFVEYSGVTGINAVSGPINDDASSANPSLTMSPTVPSLVWTLGATNSATDGSDLLTTGYSLLVNDEPPDGLGVWGSNSTVPAGVLTLTWSNPYWNAGACADGTTTTTGCTTVMAAVALSVR